jgi:tripartite-type tricarboxylate transporter receptor subunit TctC
MMKIPRRYLLHLATGVALTAASRSVWADNYPTHPVRIVVGFAAGSTSDILARLMGQWLSERLNQQFVVENRPGAGGNVGAETVVKAAPDGYTLLMVPPAVAANDALYEHLNFNFIRDAAPVAGVVRVPNVVEVNPSVPVKTVPELIAYAKANPRALSFASAGIGTISHLAGQLFNTATGINLQHVPYRGDGPAMADLIAGQVQVGFGTMTASIGIFAPTSFGRWQSPLSAAPMRCRASRPWVISCRATRRARGSASPLRAGRRSRLSKSSTARPMQASPIRGSKHGSRIWAECC